MRLVDLTILIEILPVIIGSIRFYKDKHLFPLVIFLFYGLLTDLHIVYVYNDFHLVSRNNAIAVFSLFCLIETLYYIHFMRKLYSTSTMKKFARITFWATIPIMLIAIIAKNPWEGQTTLNAIFLSYSNIVITILSAQLLLHLSEMQATTQVNWWIVISIFVYAFCSLLFSLLADAPIIHDMYFMQRVINIIGQVLFCYAFLQRNAPPTPKET